jgi:hypothetical protein
MNYMLHGKRLLTHLGLSALLLAFAGIPPRASAAPPGGVILITPTEGAVLNSPAQAEFTWSQSDPPATWFLLTIIKDGVNFISTWIPTNHFTAVNGLPGGNFTWTVRTWNPDGLGPFSGPATFSVVPGAPGTVTLISPVNTVETNSTLNFIFTQDPSSTWFELFINKDGRFFREHWFGPSETTISGGNVIVTVASFTSGTFTWWVRPWGPDGFGSWSSSATFTVQVNGEPGQVTLLSPPNGGTSPSITTLTWSMPDPAAQWFFVWMNKDNTTFFTKWVQTNSITFNNGLPSGNFSWWVRPWNSAGFGMWSSTSTFTVVGGAPTNTIVLVNPPNGSTTTNSIIDYTWTADPNATWYQLFINHNNSLFLNHWYNTSELSFSDLGGGVSGATVTIGGHSTGVYNWWVRAWSPDGIGNWSAMSTFTRTAP